MTEKEIRLEAYFITGQILHLDEAIKVLESKINMKLEL